MSKVKMRCINCGKWFQSANAKEVTCPDCTQKLRKEKLAAKATPGAPQNTPAPGIQPPRPAIPPPPKAKSSTGGTSHWLDTVNDVKVSEPEPPAARPKLPPTPAPDIRERDNRGGPERSGQRVPGPGGYRDRDAPRGPGNYREGGYRGPGSYRETDYHSPASYKTGGAIGGTIGQRPRQPMEGGPGRGPGRGPGGPYKPGDRKGKPAGQRPPAPPKPKREKIPPPTPFVPTPEQVEQVETRYKELATPAEFDGIRTQIAHELSIPKSAVKRTVKALRDREGIPSWWETQSYKGSGEDLEKIKIAYLPHLPVPAVGVHKQIAEALSMKPGEIYQAIKAIRLEMNLPQYNDPSLHPGELTPRHKAEENTQTELVAENATTGAAPAPAEAEQAVSAPAEATVEAERATSVPAEVSVEAQTAPVNIGAPVENVETPESSGATAAGNSDSPPEP